MRTLTVRDIRNHTGGALLVCLYKGETLAVFHYGDTYFVTREEALAKVKTLMADNGFTHSRVILKLVCVGLP